MLLFAFSFLDIPLFGLRLDDLLFTLFCVGWFHCVFPLYPLFPFLVVELAV
jgi:hypothetical protein